MKKIAKQKPQDRQSIDILKRVARRVEDATVDIHSMKSDLKWVNLRLGQVEKNTEIMKVDIEKMRGDIDDKLVGLEIRLNKRIANVADLITIGLDDKLRNHEKRIKKIEHIQQAA